MAPPSIRYNLAPVIPYGLALLACLAAAYLFFESRRQNAQIAELLTRGSGADQRKQQDPYLAGPVKNRILKGYR